MMPPTANSPSARKTKVPFPAKRRLLCGLLLLLLLAGPPSARAEETLIDLTEGWKFHNGSEFPGAEGQLDAAGTVLKLAFDFTAGGSYVSAARPLDLDGEIDGISIKIKGPGNAAVRLTDATGQSFIYRLGNLDGSVANHDLDLASPGQVYGGAGDKILHHPLTGLAIVASKDPSHLTGEIEVEEILVRSAGKAP
jgi:hypothetical protein